MNFLTEHSGLIVTVLFFAAFVAIGVWVYLPRNKRAMREHGEIPLKGNGDD